MLNRRRRGATTILIIVVLAISLSVRCCQKRVANICSVCAHAGEERETQNLFFLNYSFSEMFDEVKPASDGLYLTIHLQWNQCCNFIYSKINVQSLIHVNSDNKK